MYVSFFLLFISIVIFMLPIIIMLIFGIGVGPGLNDVAK